VAATVLEALDSPEFTKAYRTRQAQGGGGPEEARLLSMLREDEALLVELGRDHANRQIARPAFFAAQREVTDRIAATTRALNRIHQGRILAGLPDEAGPALQAVWDRADLEWRRSLVEVVVEKMILHPASRGARRWPADGSELAERIGRQWHFDPSKVEIVWRV
jgi:site-specific DNA recombinase